MIKVVIDTCVIIDLLDKKEGAYEDAYEVFFAAAGDKIAGYITAKTVSEVYCLTRQRTSQEITKEIINKLINILPIIDTLAADCENALFTDMTDYDKSVLSETAYRCGCEYIITRNIQNYSGSKVKAILPGEFLKLISNN